MDVLDRVKAALTEMGVPGLIRQAFPKHDKEIAPLVTVVHAPDQHGLIRVFLDATVLAEPGDEKAYEYRGRVIQHRCGDFPIDYAVAWSGDALLAQLELLVTETLKRMRAVGLFEGKALRGQRL